MDWLWSIEALWEAFIYLIRDNPELSITIAVILLIVVLAPLITFLEDYIEERDK